MAQLLPRDAALPAEFGVFPLAGALLLPRGKLPLNVFEQRYLSLTEDALGAGRMFGMIQPDPNAPAGPNGPGLYEIAADAAGVRRDVPTPLDLTRPIADLAFEKAAARRLAGDAAAAAVDRALLTGAGLLASEQLGLAQWCLDETVRYLGERRQFGRIVGSFQALKHRLADLWLEVVSARAAGPAFDLGCKVREGLYTWLSQHRPDALPNMRQINRDGDVGSGT